MFRERARGAVQLSSKTCVVVVIVWMDGCIYVCICVQGIYRMLYIVCYRDI